MNRLILLLFLPFFTTTFGQIQEFKIPAENDGYFDLSVKKNDTVLIKETSTHILSLKTYQAYQSFKENYLICLEERQNDIIAINKKLQDFNQSLDKLIADLEKQNNLSSDILKNTETELTNLLDDINSDINQLNSIQNAIDEADEKLTEIQKKLKKEKAKLVWRKIGDLALAGGLGILVGAAFF